MCDDAEKLQDVGFLQDIISYVFDEKKIVTYKWISKALNIHVNKAKQLLYIFVKHLPDERLEQLEVTYLVGGILPNNGGCRIQIVFKEDLPKVKKHFEVITSEHIYSVSFKKCLTDLHDLYTVDGVKSSELPGHGALRCNQSLERDADEFAAKRISAQKSIKDGKKWLTDKPKEQNGTVGNDKKKPVTGISAMFAASSNKKKTEESSELKKTENELKKEEIPPMKKDEIPPVKKEEIPPVKKGPPGKAAEKDVKGSGGGRLAAMFSAQSSKPKPVKKKEEQTEKPEIKDAEIPEKPVLEKKPLLQKESKETEKEIQNKGFGEKQKPNVKRSQNSKSKQKKRKAREEDDKNTKRKRILIVAESDSSDDDIFGSEGDEEEAIDGGRCPNIVAEDEESEDTHENNRKKEEVINPEEQPRRGHARKRVVVNKTFMDEEGYIVSKKVVEFVSCSEEEDEKENEKETEEGKKTEEERGTEKERGTVKESGKKATKKSASKIPSPSAKKKQATLMSFFKRS